MVTYTSSNSHRHDDVKAGLVPLLKTWPGIPAEENWHFVFIIPTNGIVITPQLPAALEKLPVSSATIDVVHHVESTSPKWQQQVDDNIVDVSRRASPPKIDKQGT